VIIATKKSARPRPQSKAALVSIYFIRQIRALVQADGVLIANASLVNRDFSRADIRSIMVPANEIAEALVTAG